MTITAKQREVLQRMANHERLSIRPAAFRAWLDRHDAIESEPVSYDDVMALRDAGFVEVQEIAKPLVVMRLTELGRAAAKGEV